MRDQSSERRLERETGIEPATNSLEGCDSTTELLPPSFSLDASSNYGEAGPPSRSSAALTGAAARTPACFTFA